MQLRARLRVVSRLGTLLFGPVVAELLDLRSATRAELLHDGLLLGRTCVQQLQNLLTHLEIIIIKKTSSWRCIHQPPFRPPNALNDSSHLFALLLLGGLLVQEAFNLHVQMRRLAFADPALLLGCAPRRRGGELRRGGRSQRGGGVGWRSGALKRGREAAGSFAEGLLLGFPLDSSPLGSSHRPNHGPEFCVVHRYDNCGGGGGRGSLSNLDELLS